MDNVIRIFAQKNNEIALSEPATDISPAMTGILASTEHLGQTVKDILKHFDAIENAIDTIEDAEKRSRLKQSTKMSKETLLKAMLQLTRQIEKIVGCHSA